MPADEHLDAAELCGDCWRGGILLPTFESDGEPDEDDNTVMVEIEQAEKGSSAVDVTFVCGSTTFSIVCLAPRELERLADFCNEAADKVRKCSTE